MREAEAQVQTFASLGFISGSSEFLFLFVVRGDLAGSAASLRKLPYVPAADLKSSSCLKIIRPFTTCEANCANSDHTIVVEHSSALM